MTDQWDAGRLDSDLEGVGFDTLAVRAGQHRTPEGEHSEALFLTSSYVFRTAADAAARFAGETPGNVYSRYTNPTVRAFEERLAAMEGAEQAVATSTGMAAILAVVMSLCSAGDHVLVSQSVFGSTISLFEKYFKRFGVQVDYVPLVDLNGWEKAIKANTKLLIVESPSNPLAELVDITALAEIAHARGAMLVVDNCFCTPALQQPLKLGADIVFHSATKFIDGQGRCMGGVVAGRSEQMKEVVGFLRTAGPTLSPFNAWIFTKGLETLKLRMRRTAKRPAPGRVAGAAGRRGEGALRRPAEPSAARTGQAPDERFRCGGQLRGQGWQRGRLALHRCDPGDFDHHQPG
jgi:O-succinylhomoserine sulfhydrylase